MANTIKKVTITEKGLGSGPYYDAYYSPDCVNYYPAISGSVLYLPTLGSTGDIVIDSSAQCIKLINQADKCNYNYKVDTFTTTTTTTIGPTTTTTTTAGPTTTTTTAGIFPPSAYVIYDFGNTTSYPATGDKVYDISGNGHTGSLINSPVWTNNCGGELRFDNSQGQRIEYSAQFAPNTTTVVIWKNYDTNFGHEAGFPSARFANGLVADTIPNKDYTAIGYGDGGASTTFFSSTITPSDITIWHQYATVLTSNVGAGQTTNTNYLDGTSISATETKSLTRSSIGSGTAYIGFDNGGSGRFANGYIMAYLHYNRQLTTSDLNQIYNYYYTRFNCGGQTTTTTTTTTAAPVWYTLAPCDNPSQSGQYSTQKPNGTFSVGQIVIYGGTRYFTVTAVNYSDPGGTQWLVVDSGLASCPTTTTTIPPTTTLPPLQIIQSSVGCSGGAGTVTSTMSGGTGTYSAIAYDNYQSNVAILVNGGAGSGLGQRITSPSNPNVWTSIPNGTWYFAVKDSAGGVSVNNTPITINCGTTTTTTAAPVLGCYNISYQLVYTTGCNGFGDITTLYTISLQDQNGNPYVTPTNLTFQFTYNYDDVQDYGGSSGVGTRDLVVYAGHSSGQMGFLTKNYQYCNYATVCDGTCYITEHDEYVSYSPIPQC